MKRWYSFKSKDRKVKIIRVFPRRTNMTPKDDFVFIGDPPMFRPKADEVHISISFTWDIDEGFRLAQAWHRYYPIVGIGGPALRSIASTFQPGLYIKRGVTFTSRGCNNRCPWCLVPDREGKIKELPVMLGFLIQDNNLLQCSKIHIQRVFQMLRTQRKIQFTGGLDSRLLTDDIADDLHSLRISQLFLSCDTKEAINPLRKAIARLRGLSRDKLRCYVLLAFSGETISDATERLEMVWEAGAMPFAQLYQPPTEKRIEYSKEWRDLARIFSRPAATKAYMSKSGEVCGLFRGGSW